jgi:hypothetical protein
VSRSLVLTERDHELLGSLLEYRYLSTSQIQRLHFPSSQTAARRLRLLAQGGYLATFRTIACQDRIATLSRLGAAAVAERTGVPADSKGTNGNRRKPKDYLFLQHFLAATDFRITLAQACARHPSLKLLGFISEYESRPSPSGSIHKYVRDTVSDKIDRRTITHAPDGVFALEHDGRSALFFVEIDRGTEVVSNPEKGFLKMLRFYLIYLRDGGYQRYQRDFGVEKSFKGFRALVVTTSRTRLENMRAAAGRLSFTPAQAKRFIWLSSMDVVLDPEILTSSWIPSDPTEKELYQLLPASLA